MANPTGLPVLSVEKITEYWLEISKSHVISPYSNSPKGYCYETLIGRLPSAMYHYWFQTSEKEFPKSSFESTFVDACKLWCNLKTARNGFLERLVKSFHFLGHCINTYAQTPMKYKSNTNAFLDIPEFISYVCFLWSFMQNPQTTEDLIIERQWFHKISVTLLQNPGFHTAIFEFQKMMEYLPLETEKKNNLDCFPGTAVFTLMEQENTNLSELYKSLWPEAPKENSFVAGRLKLQQEQGIRLPEDMADGAFRELVEELSKVDTERKLENLKNKYGESLVVGLQGLIPEANWENVGIDSPSGGQLNKDAILNALNEPDQQQQPLEQKDKNDSKKRPAGSTTESSQAKKTKTKAAMSDEYLTTLKNKWETKKSLILKNRIQANGLFWDADETPQEATIEVPQAFKEYSEKLTQGGEIPESYLGFLIGKKSDFRSMPMSYGNLSFGDMPLAHFPTISLQSICLKISKLKKYKGLQEAVPWELVMRVPGNENMIRHVVDKKDVYNMLLKWGEQNESAITKFDMPKLEGHPFMNFANDDFERTLVILDLHPCINPCIWQTRTDLALDMKWDAVKSLTGIDANMQEFTKANIDRQDLRAQGAVFDRFLDVFLSPELSEMIPFYILFGWISPKRVTWRNESILHLMVNSGQASGSYKETFMCVRKLIEAANKQNWTDMSSFHPWFYTMIKEKDVDIPNQVIFSARELQLLDSMVFLSQKNYETYSETLRLQVINLVEVLTLANEETDVRSVQIGSLKCHLVSDSNLKYVSELGVWLMFNKA